jgi:hypothetical protein
MKSPSGRGNHRQSHPAVGAPSTIRVDARYDATCERVFNAWLDPDVAGRWLFATATRPIAHVEIEPRETGCRLSLAHENVPFDLLRGTEARWTGILYGLGVTLASFAGEPLPKRRPIALDAVPGRPALTRAAGRREPQPPRNPRSE